MNKRNLNPELFDARMIETHLREGKINKSQIQALLSGLPDEAEHAEKIVIDDDSLSGNAGYTAELSDDTTDY